MLVYIPPSGNVTRVAETIASCVHRLKAASPAFVLGDFNGCRMNKSLPTYHQYVTCANRASKTSDLCYRNLKDAYRAKKPLLSTADHNVVH